MSVPWDIIFLVGVVVVSGLILVPQFIHGLRKHDRLSDEWPSSDGRRK